jgi:hypothetical protein
VIRWWRRGVSLIVLFMLAAAPAVAAACAELCMLEANSSAMADDGLADHDAALSECHNGGTSAAATSLLPANPCDDHSPAAAGTASLTAGREDTHILQIAQAPTTSPVATAAGEALLAPIRGATAQPTPPRPTSALLVLRI